MGDCVTLATIQNFAAVDNPRLYGDTAKAISRDAVWANVFPSGKLDNNMGTSFRINVQERAVSANSLVNPAFAADVTMCRSIPGVDRYGSREYVMQLLSMRGRSGPVCVKGAKTVVKGAYTRVSESLKTLIRDLVNSECRAQGIFQSGSKFVADSTGTFGQDFAGTIGGIAQPFPGRVPDSAMGFASIKKIANYMRDVFSVDPYQASGSGARMALVICGSDQTDMFRSEVGIKADFRAMVTGRYNLGNEVLSGFYFEGPYQEIGFGVDPQPVRAMNVAGGAAAVLSPNAAPYTTSWVPGHAPADVTAGTTTQAMAFMEPEIAVAVTNGFGSRPNPAWVAADFEVGAILFDNSFRRLTPQTYRGEGDLAFPAQLGLETLEFYAGRDMDCNLYGDTGVFLYEISRAYEPERPEAICAFLYKRCNTGSLGLVPCA